MVPSLVEILVHPFKDASVMDMFLYSISHTFITRIQNVRANVVIFAVDAISRKKIPNTQMSPQIHTYIVFGISHVK